MSTDQDGLGSLVERMYQGELAQHARERNTILAVDTGTGKTLIAAMVIRWKLAMDRMNTPDRGGSSRKIAMFLVPKVPLVEQQRKVMDDNTDKDIIVKGYTGAMGVDFWDRTAWQKEFNEADILVMTPQIFLNVLRHAHWSLSQVSMIVFDEVHNCKGRSPEAQIMNDHYHTFQPANARPKILGLTASPVFNHKNPITALHQMERLTDCKVVVVRQNADELTKFTFQAKDRIIDYATSPSVWPVYENPSLWAELHAKKLLPNDLLFPKKDKRKEQLASEWYRALADRYRSTILALGPFAADLFVLVHMTTALEGVRNDLDPLYPETIDQDAKRRASLNETLAVMEKHQSRLSSDGDELKHEWLSPRLLALKALLLEHHNVPEFRGIIFCYERQYATTLSLLLPRLGVPGIRAGPLVGHGQNACAEPTKVGMRGMAFRAQENIVEDFRRGDLNLLIATSVAEEGLDFPLCSFVCRFDPPRTLPQYIQSRGRARKEGSSFVIMLEKGPSLDRGRLEALQLSEGRLKKMYGRNMDTKKGEADASDDYDEDDTFEGRFTVEKTGASITPAGSIALLENLCSLIPVDPHTNPLRPKYNMRTLMPLGDFRCSVLLPAALPIPRENLLLKSDPEARSKKAAKRSAAFNAVRMLYKLGVFDDYLLPLRREKGDVAEDVDGKSPIDVTGIEPMMNVLVHDAWGDMWQEDAQLYVHRLEISGETGMGLVCAVCLPEYEGMMVASRREKPVRVFKGVAVEMDNAERTKALALMQEYTKRGIRYSITRKGLLDRNLCLFLVPLDHHGHPDYDAMERCIRSPASQDWSTIDLSGATDVLVSTIYDTKVSKLIRRRSDVQVAECIAKSTYLTKATENLKKLGRDIPENDLILECREVLQATSTDFREPSRQKAGILAEHSILLPQSLCQWVNFHQETIAWYLLLPPLANLLQSVHRARLVQKMLQIPLSLDRTIEAFTVPSANASFSNQRLETLGDTFLKVATSIHVFKKFPYKHEGQLTVLKMNSISNRYLLGRGHVRDLPSYINIEPNNQAKWRLTTNLTGRVDGAWMARRKIPRRSVQDCMEALLGVAWLSGGVKTALAAGTELGLCFGGSEAWWDRYPSDEMEVCTGSPFPTLEDTLGYQFKNKSLLLEALTHPSFAKGGPCYQRLEFLGDAVLDLVVMDHFFKKFPDAGSGKLTRARARCVCAQTLSAIATKKLDVHKNIFCDSISLVKDMTRTAQQVFDGMTFAEIIDSIWKLDVPKALSDVVEALLGAVLIDCGWRYDVVEEVIMKLFKEILDYVDPDMPADPATEFMLWVGRHGCTQVKYRRCSSSQEIAPRKDHCFVVVHDIDIGPATIIEPKKTAVMARASAALQARLLLSDPHSEFAFDKLCTCTKKEKVHNATLYQAAADLVSDLADLDPETTEGFAIDTQLQLAKMEEMNADETVDEDTADDGEEEIMSGPAPDREDAAAKT